MAIAQKLSKKTAARNRLEVRDTSSRMRKWAKKRKYSNPSRALRETESAARKKLIVLSSSAKKALETIQHYKEKLKSGEISDERYNHKTATASVFVSVYESLINLFEKSCDSNTKDTYVLSRINVVADMISNLDFEKKEPNLKYPKNVILGVLLSQKSARNQIEFAKKVYEDSMAELGSCFEELGVKPPKKPTVIAYGENIIH